MEHQGKECSMTKSKKLLYTVSTSRTSVGYISNHRPKMSKWCVILFDRERPNLIWPQRFLFTTTYTIIPRKCAMAWPGPAPVRLKALSPPSQDPVTQCTDRGGPLFWRLCCAPLSCSTHWEPLRCSRKPVCLLYQERGKCQVLRGHSSKQELSLTGICFNQA